MLNAQKTALIIIDLQNDFLAPDGAYARGSAGQLTVKDLPERLVSLAQVLKSKGGLVVGSQFTLWPGADGEPMISPHLKALRPFLKRGDFAPGSHGQDNVPALKPWVDVNVQKVAYSAFFNTQLDWVLKKAGIDTVLVAGIVTNGGVASTVRDAHLRDYHIHVVEDGCAAFSQAAHDTSIKDMGMIAHVTCCQALIQQLQG